MIDPARLARAVHLTAHRTGPDTWTVEGGAEPHTVTRKGKRFDCDCLDRGVRRARCKHLLSIGLRLGHPVVLKALQTLIPEKSR